MSIYKTLLISTFLAATQAMVVKIQSSDSCDIAQGVEVGQMENKDYEEASGLAVSRIQGGVLWTHNDHGDEARVFAIGEDGKERLEVHLEGVENEDWEDIAVGELDGESYLYVSDTGNNDHDKESLHVIRFKEPVLDGRSDLSISRDDIEYLEVTYPGFSYDCEALAVDPQTKDIFLFTKDREESISEVYRYPAPQSESLNPFTLEHVGTLPLNWITGADISPSGDILALTNKQVAFSLTKPVDLSWADFLSTGPDTCTLHLEEEAQREAIAVTDSGYWTTSECKHDPSCPLWYYARN